MSTPFQVMMIGSRWVMVPSGEPVKRIGFMGAGVATRVPRVGRESSRGYAALIGGVTVVRRRAPGIKCGEAVRPVVSVVFALLFSPRRRDLRLFECSCWVHAWGGRKVCARG
jgi:hypothetical protein